MKFIVLIAPVLFAVACGHVRTDGGQANFDSSTYQSLAPADQATYAQTVVKREERDPEGITLKQLVESPQGQIKKVAVILFETQFQSSITGLAVTGDNVYLSERGKQILAQETREYWFHALKQVPVSVVPPKELQKSPAYRSYGSVVDDLSLQHRPKLTEEDAFWKKGGQTIPTGVVVLPPNEQDVSVLYIPASEMMIIPKMVEHQKHWVNDICKELQLDAVILVTSTASWTQGGKDKRTQEVIPEEMEISLGAAVLYPFNRYQAAGEKLGKKDLPKKSIPLAVYSVKTKFPVTITVPESEHNFKTTEKNILIPFRSTYRVLTDLVIDRMVTDVRETQR